LVATEIHALEALSQTMTESSPDRPKLLRRLAESYEDLARAGERDGAANLVDNARKAAARNYTMLLESYPSECHAGSAGCADEVAYLLALEYERLGMLNDARKRYLDVLQRYPSSRFVPFAYLAFGEQFADEATHDETKWMLAEQAYEKVISFPPPDNRVYGYALLRLAQIQARLGRSDKARAIGSRLRALAARTPGPHAEIPARLLDAGASGARVAIP
jgi:TolA-binding protein